MNKLLNYLGECLKLLDNVEKLIVEIGNKNRTKILLDKKVKLEEEIKNIENRLLQE